MQYTLDEVEARIDESLPSLSSTAAKIISLASDLNCKPAELTRAVKLDPVLCARIMRLVNSAYFGLGEKVVSPEKAVILVGLNTVRNLALGAAILAGLERPGLTYPFDTDAFWPHSLGVGAAARFIARRSSLIGKGRGDDFFLAGMLHDIGLLVESLIYPEEMRRVLLTSRALGLVTMEEAELDGLNHCLVGEVLGRKWGLPREILDVLAGHHAPASRPGPMVQAVYLANRICENHDVGLVLDDVPAPAAPGTHRGLGVQPEIEDEILQVIDGEIDKAREFLRT